MKTITSSKTTLLFIVMLLLSFSSCYQVMHEDEFKIEKKKEGKKKKKKEGYDGPAQAMQQEFDKIMDPTLGVIPQFRMEAARQKTKALENENIQYASRSGGWQERGPYQDAPGISNGNSRGVSNASTGGRIRAVLVDAADPTGKTVFIGSASGGIWKTNDITAAVANWVPVDDFLSNLAITGITQDPSNPSIIYFCTGESFYNIGSVQGEGVFKSIDGGASFTQLPSSKLFTYSTRIVCDYQGKIYLATRDGLKRSLNGGSSWEDVTPTGMDRRICDLRISSTTAPGRLHIVSGIFSAQTYRYTDAPQTVSTTGYTAPVTPFPSYNMRAEIAVSGNVLYALPANSTHEVPAIYKSTDGGANWTVTGSQPSAGWAAGQAWYNLSVAINPANSNEVIVGGLDNWRSTNGGATWTQISSWIGTQVNYCHADQHAAIWYDNGNKLLSANDGGLFYSTNKGTTFNDRNIGLRIKQFYSVAMHPTLPNYFLAGAQDNGSHQLSSAGLSTSIEVTGGDGGFVHIDKDQPIYQFTSYVYNQVRRSRTDGTYWIPIDLASSGRFINPSDYDDDANIMYSSTIAGGYKRWLNPQLTTTPVENDVMISELGTSQVSIITTSPYTADRIYVGSSGGNGSKLLRISKARTRESGATTDILNITPANANPGGYLSSIAIGSNENNLIACYANFGINNLYATSDGGTSWTAIDGNLPDMPVRWVIYDPNSNTKAIIATELGVWFTNQINGANTIWIPSPGFPKVRTDMLQYRESDDMIAAATYGRGIWTSKSAEVLPVENFELSAAWNDKGANLSWNFIASNVGTGLFTIQSSTNGTEFHDVISQNRTSTNDFSSKITAVSVPTIYFKIKYTGIDGEIAYSNVVKLSGNKNVKSNVAIIGLYPNPTVNSISVNYFTPAAGNATYSIIDQAGRTVWKKSEKAAYQGNFITTQNVSNLSAGAYIFTVIINGERTQQRFIKQ
jgi:hypothetical protein